MLAKNLEWNLPRVVGIIQIRTFQSQKSHYEILGVPQNASLKEIKSAFYEKSKKLHPDNLSEGGSSERFLELKNAYDILRRPADRRLYDIRLNGGSPNGRIYRGYDYRNPYSGYGAPPQYDFSKDWSAHWSQNPDTRGTREARDQNTKEFMRSIAIYMGIGVVLITLYNGGYLWMLSWRQKQLEKLSDEDEIAKCFLRQKEFRDAHFEPSEIMELGRVLKADVDDLWKAKCDEQKNTNEIREEYRWFRAVQDAQTIRNLKKERADRKNEARNRWREETD